MTMLSRSEAEALLKKVLSFSKADELEATLNGGRLANTRFAVNSASTSGDTDNLTLIVNAHFGQRGGVATTNTLDDAGLERVVRAAEEIAKLRPEDPELQPFLGKQDYVEIKDGFDEATYNADAAALYRSRQHARQLRLRHQLASLLHDDRPHCRRSRLRLGFRDVASDTRHRCCGGRRALD